MALASTSARFVSLRIIGLLVAGIGLFSSCTSPLELDVDRSKSFMDGSKNPTRLSFFYYFGDSAYEAIVTDPTFLEKIWIEPQENSEIVNVTIPKFLFQIPETAQPSAVHNPLVKVLSFATWSHPADGLWRNCLNPDSWLQGDYIGRDGEPEEFTWMCDNNGRQVRIAYVKVRDQNVIKGSMQIIVAEPLYGQTYAVYRALITIEY